MVKFQAHRGVCGENPENTMPAFRAAWEQGTEVWGLARNGILSLGSASLLGGPEQIAFRLWASIISKACGVSLPAQRLSACDLCDFDNKLATGCA